jgi:hypothetical protein
MPEEAHRTVHVLLAGVIRVNVFLVRTIRVRPDCHAVAFLHFSEKLFCELHCVTTPRGEFRLHPVTSSISLSSRKNSDYFAG